MANYIALIDKGADSDFGVSFPDFPRVVTAGPNLDEARTMVKEALHVEGMIEGGEAIPDASSLEVVMADPENRDGVVILVKLTGPARRSVRVNVTLPEDALAEIDRFAEQHGFSRSGLPVQAAKRMMEAA